MMTIGIKSVREICTRCPLVMTPELLQARPRAGTGAGAGRLAEPRAALLQTRAVVLHLRQRRWSGRAGALQRGGCLQGMSQL